VTTTPDLGPYLHLKALQGILSAWSRCEETAPQGREPELPLPDLEAYLASPTEWLAREAWRLAPDQDPVPFSELVTDGAVLARLAFGPNSLVIGPDGQRLALITFLAASTQEQLQQMAQANKTGLDPSIDSELAEPLGRVGE
jgi:hypothetical protein